MRPRKRRSHCFCIGSNFLQFHAIIFVMNTLMMRRAGFLLMLCSFLGCSGKKDIVETPQSSQARELEWAIQFYESQHYKDALAKFSKLASEGSLVPAYPFVPFYQ